MTTLTNFLFTSAHVKWFTGVWPAQPEEIAHVLTLAFFLAAGLTLLVALVLTWSNIPLQQLPWVGRIHDRLDALRYMTPWLVRTGLAVPLVAAGAFGFLFQYELTPIPAWMRIAQIVSGLLLLLPKTDRLGAAGVISLYLVGTTAFGIHPLLDYIIWPGTAYYLLTRHTKLSASALPVIYIVAGLSLSWAAVEKWVYPAMALDILTVHRVPTFGVPSDLFLMLSAWIELGVGYLLITGVLNRLLSIVVTGLFVMTSSVFGAKEILGHWLFHAVLLAFIIEGTGGYVTPVLWHRPKWLQLAFVGVTLAPFVAGLMWLYYTL